MHIAMYVARLKSNTGGISPCSNSTTIGTLACNDISMMEDLTIQSQHNDGLLLDRLVRRTAEIQNVSYFVTASPTTKAGTRVTET
jgi:hypothetical protein